MHPWATQEPLQLPRPPAAGRPELPCDRPLEGRPISLGVGEHVQGPPRRGGVGQVWRSPPSGSRAAAATPSSSLESRGVGGQCKQGVQACMAGTRPEGLAQGGTWGTSQPWQTGSEQAPSSCSNLPCGQPRRYRRREAGHGDTLGHLGRLHWQVRRAALGPRMTAHWMSSWVTSRQSQPCPHLDLS